MSKMIPTVFTDEQELLRALIKLHAPNGIELDPMYFKGNFYKEIVAPELKFDINPLLPGVTYGDARNLDIDPSSINCMILDPPFMFGIHGKTREYYSSRTHGILTSFEDLEHLYCGILAEAYRILCVNGVLFFKCQDYTDSKTTFSHCHTWQWAIEAGFYPKDLAILHLTRGKVWNSKLTQRHMRKVHSYFWVLIKKRSRRK